MNMQVGIDEVGRGCWAGPLVAAAVILNEKINGLDDSKALNKKKREALTIEITNSAHIGIGWVYPDDIDRLGLTQSVRLAMQRAIDEIDCVYQSVIIDGNYNYLDQIQNSQAIIKADSTIPSVSAASIVAKVARDQYMQNLPDEYSIWEFDKHVGYGTKRHIELLEKFGVSDIHRRSYKPIKRLLK